MPGAGECPERAADQRKRPPEPPKHTKAPAGAAETHVSGGRSRRLLALWPKIRRNARKRRRTPAPSCVLVVARRLSCVWSPWRPIAAVNASPAPDDEEVRTVRESPAHASVRRKGIWGPSDGPETPPSPLRPRAGDPVPIRVPPEPTRVPPEPTRVPPEPTRVSPVPIRVSPVPIRVSPVPIRVPPEPSPMTPPPGAQLAAADATG